MKKRYCLQCDDGTQLEYAVRDVSDTVEGELVHVPSVEGWHCPVCGEIEFAPDSHDAKRYAQAMHAARERAIERRVQELRQMRRSLKLTQAEAGRLFGGGVSAFSAYEHGKTQPHKSTVLLLRLLSQHPQLLDEVRASASA